MRKLIIALFLAGALALGTAVPAFADGPAVGKCPTGGPPGGWLLLPVDDGDPVDRNGDGRACFNKKTGAVIDNVIPPAKLVKQHELNSNQLK